MNESEIATFIIPVYIQNDDQLRFLEETIQGIKKQTDDRWVAVFVEDCSPYEGVKELLKKYQAKDSRIHVIELKSRITTGSCRNIGIEWACNRNYPFILFNDADDVPHSRRVEVVRNTFSQFPNIGVVYSGFKVIDEHNNLVSMDKLSAPIREIIESLEEHPPQGRNCWYKIGIFSGYSNITSSTSVRTDLAMTELFPDEMVSEDSHTWLRYAARSEFYYTPDIPTCYRIPSYVKRQSSASYVDNFNIEKARVDYDGFSKALDIVEQKGTITSSSRNLIESEFLLRLSEFIGRDNDFTLAYKIAMQAKQKLNCAIEQQKLQLIV